MSFSKFGARFGANSGIVQLMDDLGEAMSGGNSVMMLGGGNPAHIPEVQQMFTERMQRLVLNPAEFSHVIGNYDPPQGDKIFILSLVDLFNRQYGWDLQPGNVVLTAGSQFAFFLLFNMFAGEFNDGSRKKILLPLTPEYIGYCDVGLIDDCFVSNQPDIEMLDNNLFKYHVDFDDLEIASDIGAMCVSRPTNPTGNVLTDYEMARLTGLAAEHKIPLIIDNAYGMPFPDIVFTEASLNYDQNTILCMSLSKLGLPGTRTGIIIASEDIITTIARMNAIFSLAVGSFGPALALDLITSGEVIKLSRNVIRPYYRSKAEHAVKLFRKALAGLEFYIHKPEGAIFLWLWFPGLPVSAEELYHRLKKRAVLIIPGHHFFPGIQDEWRHRHECIRVTYAMHETIVARGIEIIADEVKTVFQQASGGQSK